MYFRHIEDESAASPATSLSPPELTRRQFLQLTSLAGSGLTLGMLLPGCGSQPGAGRKATLGELAGAAAKLPVPANVPLKNPTDFKIVGNEKVPRLDARAKSTGKQQFAIDVMLPEMMAAVVMRPPRFGARASSFDASKAKAVAGVVDVVQIPRGVAVVGRDMWSAKAGRAALSGTWHESDAET